MSIAWGVSWHVRDIEVEYIHAGQGKISVTFFLIRAQV